MVNDTSVSSLDWSGIRPSASLTIRGRDAGGTSMTAKAVWSICLPHEHPGWPRKGEYVWTASVTFGSDAIGSGFSA